MGDPKGLFVGGFAGCGVKKPNTSSNTSSARSRDEPGKVRTHDNTSSSSTPKTKARSSSSRCATLTVASIHDRPSLFWSDGEPAPSPGQRCPPTTLDLSFEGNVARQQRPLRVPRATLPSKHGFFVVRGQASGPPTLAPRQNTQRCCKTNAATLPPRATLPSKNESRVPRGQRCPRGTVALLFEGNVAPR